MFYNRYVPPSKGQPIGSSSQEPPSKKHKKSHKDTPLNSHEPKKTGSSSIEKPPSKPEAIVSISGLNSTKSKSALNAASDVNVFPKNTRPDNNSLLPKPNGNSIESIQVVKAPVASAPEKPKKSKGSKGRKDTGHSETAENDVVPDHGVEHPAFSHQPVQTLIQEEAVNSVENHKHATIRTKYEAAALSQSDVFQNADKASSQAIENDVPSLKGHGLEPIPQPAQAGEPPRVSLSSALPEWMRAPLRVQGHNVSNFTELPISPSMIESLERRGFSKAFAIQSAVLPLLLPGPKRHPGDVCISAPTGSGKTLAYALPMLESLRDKAVRRLRGLIVVPTRELVSQARDTFEMCGAGVNIGTAVGSKSLKEEQTSLVHKGIRYDPIAYEANEKRKVDEKAWMTNWDFDDILGPKDPVLALGDYVEEYSSKVDILICTPGRLVEHLQETKGFSLEHVEWLVIDEADRLLDESFQQWVNTVIPHLEYLKPINIDDLSLYQAYSIPRRRNVQKVILSATMTRDISRLMSLKLWRPRLVVAAGAEIEDGGDPLNEAEEEMHIPTLLYEVAVPIPDVENKPVFLLRLLLNILEEKNVSLHSTHATERFITETTSAAESDETSSSGSDEESPRHEKPPINSPESLKKATAISPEPSGFGILIFTNNNENALRLVRLLGLLKPDLSSQIDSLTKSSTTSSGRKKLNRLRQRKISVLIASDRASRGLDIPDLAHVINYDMPASSTAYVHRVGRTARAGKQGRAITLVGYHEARWFWNEIARADNIGRAPGKKVQKAEAMSRLSEQEKKEYEDALRILGQEARG